ncbi:MAG: quinone-dependent dihydroorotate dehydrogenase [Bacteroidetes bacterium]|nr:quinone-dependent dihydroorotate dehydrogenase [Bacteroidota bacterium]
MYNLLRNILFLFPAESVHYFSMNSLKLFCKIGFIKKIIISAFSVNDKRYERRFFNLTFKNFVGLGAGFDKNARYLSELDALGFGFIEIGTVTPIAQPGNDKPRLFRLPMDRALINRMGFNNDGVKVVAERLRKWRSKHPASNPQTTTLIIGGNIGKNKNTPNEDAWKDYEKCFEELFDCVDYFVVNVSSPNTPDLRALQEKEALKKILTHLQKLNQQKFVETGKILKPLLLKIAPDLNRNQVDDIIDLALEIKLDGLVATNTTISRENLLTSTGEISSIGAGGLSGLPVKEKSTSIVRYIHQKAPSIPIIASGGIFTASDAAEKLAAGASLVQVWTGFIYEGPSISKKILKGISGKTN